MTQKFEDKVDELSKKISTIHQSCSLLQRQTKCKDQFLSMKQGVRQRMQAIDKQLQGTQQRLLKYERRIKSCKQSIKSFSLQKHQKLKQVVQQWVYTFRDNIKQTKQNLKSYQSAAQVKIGQIEQDNSTIVCKLKQKILKNIKKSTLLIEDMSLRMRQEREDILREFDGNRKRIVQLVKERNTRYQSMQIIVEDGLIQMGAKLMGKLQLLTDKWHLKDQKTQQIMQIFIESDQLFQT